MCEALSHARDLPKLREVKTNLPPPHPVAFVGRRSKVVQDAMNHQILRMTIDTSKVSIRSSRSILLMIIVGLCTLVVVGSCRVRGIRLDA